MTASAPANVFYNGRMRNLLPLGVLLLSAMALADVRYTSTPERRTGAVADAFVRAPWVARVRVAEAMAGRFKDSSISSR